MFKNSVRTFVTAFLSLLCCVSLVFGGVSLSKTIAHAEGDETVVLDENGFYVENGAAIRIKEGQSGIRFTTVITQNYYNQVVAKYGETATIELHSVMGPSAEFESKKQEKVYSGAFDFVDGKFYCYDVAYYDNVADENKAEAYALELKLEAYLTVTPAEGETVTLSAKTGDNVRSVRGVAIDLLASEDYKQEEKAALESYVGGELTVANLDCGAQFYDTTADAESEITLKCLTAGDYAVYSGAKKVAEVTADGEQTAKVTLKGLNGLTVKNDYKLWVYSAENKTVGVVTYKAVTKIIKTAQDLAIFKISNTYIDGKAGNFADGSLFDGYYVLGNDINASGYTHNNGISNINSASDADLATNDFVSKDGVPYCGLSGTFDGNGHTISNFALPVDGLFGLIYGGTVKNVAIIANGAVKDEKNNNKNQYMALACNITKATIENVSVDNVYLNYNYGRAVLGRFLNSSSLKNVYVKVSFNKNGLTKCGGDGSLVCNVRTTSYINTFENVYVISDVKCTESADAENIVTDLAKLTGVRRYETIDAMKADTENDYTAFENSGFWSTESGYPVFKKA